MSYTITVTKSGLWAVVFAAIVCFGTTGVGAAPVTSGPVSTAEVIVGFVGLPDTAVIAAHGGTVTQEYSLIPAVAATLPTQAIDALQRNPRIDYVSPDLPVYALGDTVPWGISKINADSVQTDGNDGAAVDVYVLDTGIDYTHPDLADAYVDGYDFHNGDADPFDGDGHGTHVAGTIAAAADGSGVLGVAPGVDLYAGKVLSDSGSGSFSNVIAGIEWAVAGPDGSIGTDDDAELISMSLGASSGTDALKAAVDAAYYDYGVLVVASAGNSGNTPGKGDNVGYPANYASVIAVAATDSGDSRARFSSTGPAVELAAPGVDVLSTLPGNSYGSYSGTSMAAPHVSGAAALVMASTVVTGYDTDGDGVWDAGEVRTRLADTSVDLGASGRDTKYGYGRIDAAAAVGASGPVDVAPTITLDVPTEGATVSGPVTVTATASDTEDATADLAVAYSVAGTTTPMTYDSADDVFTADWDTTTVSDGDYTVTVTATDSSGGSATDSAGVTVDNVDAAPVVSDVTPADGATVSGTTDVSATVTDDRTAPTDLVVSFSVDGTETGTLTYDSATERFVGSWDSTTVADGQYTVTVTASDGTTTTSVANTVTVANTAIDPVVTSFTATDVSGPNPHASILAEWDVGDGNGDLSHLTVEIFDASGALAVPVHTEPLSGDRDVGTVTTDIKFGGETTYTVVLTVYDEAGGSDWAEDTA